MDWRTKSTPLPEKLELNEHKQKIRNLIERDNPELNRYVYDGSFTFFDTLRFQNQIEKITKFTVTKLKTVPIALLTYQPNFWLGFLVLKIPSQNAEMIKNILLIKMASHFFSGKSLWIKMIN